MSLDTTIGGAASDSYVTVAEADAYCTARELTWTGADAVKEAALRRAAVWLDGRYRYKWPGYKFNKRDQSLEWPRLEAFDVEDNWIDSATIPAEVKSAQIEAAVREIATAGGLSPDVTNEKVLTGLGPMTWTLTGAGASSKRPELTIVDDILSSIVQTGSTQAVMRA